MLSGWAPPRWTVIWTEEPGTELTGLTPTRGSGASSEVRGWERVLNSLEPVIPGGSCGPGLVELMVRELSLPDTDWEVAELTRFSPTLPPLLLSTLMNTLVRSIPCPLGDMTLVVELSRADLDSV